MDNIVAEDYGNQVEQIEIIQICRLIRDNTPAATVLINTKKMRHYGKDTT